MVVNGAVSIMCMSYSWGRWARCTPPPSSLCLSPNYRHPARTRHTCARRMCNAGRGLLRRWLPWLWLLLLLPSLHSSSPMSWAKGREHEEALRRCWAMAAVECVPPPLTHSWLPSNGSTSILTSSPVGTPSRGPPKSGRRVEQHASPLKPRREGSSGVSCS